MIEEQIIERLIRETKQMTETELERLIACAKAADYAEMAAELAAEEEAEIIAEIEAEEELWPEQPPARDENDEELDAAFWEAMDKDD